MKIKHKNEINNIEQQLSSSININKKVLNMEEFISENSQKIINHNLYEFSKDEDFSNIPNDIFKNEIFYFAAFINSCKNYNDILEVKNDIKKFFKNKNEDIEYHYHIINNYLKNIIEIISNNDFFNNKENMIILLKILKKIIENIFPKNNNDLLTIQKDIIYKYKLILNILEKNNTKEKIKQIIQQFKKKIENLENEINLINNNKDNNIVIDNIIKNDNKIYLNNDKSNKYKKNIINKKSPTKNININRGNKYNYENIMCPPIQNNDSK